MVKKEEVHERLQQVFQMVFDDDEIVISRETTAADIEDWDSKEHINLIISSEREFGIKFALAEISNLPDVGALVDLICVKLS